MATIADIIAQAVEGGRRNALAAYAFKQQQMAQAEKTRQEDQAALFSIAEDLNPRRARAKLNLLLSVRKIDPKNPGVKFLSELITSSNEELNTQAKELIKNYGLKMNVSQMVDQLSTEEGKRAVFTSLMKRSEPFTLTPGAQRRGPNNEILAENPPKPEKIEDVINLRFPDGRIQGFRKDDPKIDEYLKIKGVSRVGQAITGTPEQFTKPTQTKLEGQLLSLDEQLIALKDIKKAFDPNFFTTWGRLKGGLLKKMDKLGVSLDPQQKDFLVAQTSLFLDSARQLNDYIRAVTGATVGVDEAKRLKLGTIDVENDSPLTFQTKLDRSLEIGEAAKKRYEAALQNGLLKAGDPITQEVIVRLKAKGITLEKFIFQQKRDVRQSESILEQRYSQ